MANVKEKLKKKLIWHFESVIEMNSDSHLKLPIKFSIINVKILNVLCLQILQIWLMKFIDMKGRRDKSGDFENWGV